MPSAARVIAIAALVLSGCGSASADDPEDANCSTVTAQYGASRDVSDHREVDVRFSCEGAQQSATAYLPTGAGPYPGVVWVHGNGPERRLSYGPGITSALVQAGIAVLSYDKRGVGQSQGSCCPGDAGHFNLIAADATGAVNALSAMPGIDARHVGLIGASQAGWLIPIEATRSSKVAFIAVADGPTV